MLKSIYKFNDYYSYTKGIKLNICRRDNGNREIIGELSGHFFNLALLDRDKKMPKIITVLQQYNEETYDICRNLVRETGCHKGKGENIYHLDRLYIEPKFRGNGIGRNILQGFEQNIEQIIGENVRYIGLYPDPITNDLRYDSMEDMSKQERDIKVRSLKNFYSSLGFKEMKCEPNYMYLDLKEMEAKFLFHTI